MTRSRWYALALILPATLAYLLPSGAHASVSRQTDTLTYHDAAVAFTYPAVWTVMPSDAVQKMKAAIAQSNAPFRVTDIGGVRNVSGLGLNAVILVTRYRLSRRARSLALKDQLAFLDSFLSGVVHASKRVFDKGSTIIGGVPAADIE